mgnify:FL=1
MSFSLVLVTKNYKYYDVGSWAFVFPENSLPSCTKLIWWWNKGNFLGIKTHDVWLTLYLHVKLSRQLDDILYKFLFLLFLLTEKYGFSMSRRKPSSPLYQSKRQLSHTYPMSDLELKALYWRPPVLSHHRRDKLWYGTDPREEDLKR